MKLDLKDILKNWHHMLLDEPDKKEFQKKLPLADKHTINWIGSKFRIRNETTALFPKKGTDYLIEPFCGSGIITLNSWPKKAWINDLNSEIIDYFKYSYENTDDFKMLVRYLPHHKDLNDLYFIFNELPRPLQIAVWRKAMLYAKYSIIYVAIADPSKGRRQLWRHPDMKQRNWKIVQRIEQLSDELKKIEKLKITNKHFTEIPTNEPNAFYYLDPPYDGTEKVYKASNKSNGKKLQEQIKNYCDEINKSGNKFCLHNENTDYIKNFYKDYYQVSIINTHKSEMQNVVKDKEKRKAVNNIAILNYDPKTEKVIHGKNTKKPTHKKNVSNKIKKGGIYKREIMDVSKKYEKNEKWNKKRDNNE